MVFLKDIEHDVTSELSEWLKPKTLITPNADKDEEQQECSLTAGGNANCSSHCGRQFTVKLNIGLPYSPAITLLVIYPIEFKTYVQQKTCTWMSVTALFIIAPNWK